MEIFKGTNYVKIFGVKIDKVTMEEANSRLISFMQGDELKMVFTPNPEFIMRAQEDAEFKEILCQGDLVVPDGIGLIKASNIHHLELPERIPGIELMEKALEFCNRSQKSIFIFAGKPGVAEAAAKKISEKYPNLVVKGTQDGYFEEKDELRILDRINEAKPDLLIVGLGAPKQEKWIYKHRKIINAKVAIGIGGAVDVWGGAAKRAPKLFIKMNLEWLYRLLMNPSRIGRMMVLPKFMIKVIFSKTIDH